MAGPGKKRAGQEKAASSSTDTQQSSRDTAQQGTAKPIAAYDGHGDSSALVPINYSNERDLKNISEFLGMAGWYAARGSTIPQGLPQRPPILNQYGREAFVSLNTYQVLQNPNGVAHQYDVSWSPGVQDKRALIKKLWASETTKKELGNGHWIYDGNKLAWSSSKLPRDEVRIIVDLDEEDDEKARKAGKTPRNRGPGPSRNKHTIFLRHTRKIDYTVIDAFLSGHINWTPECIDTINFFDHVLREQPSRNYTQIKKSFFQRGEKRADLGGGIEAFKGVFSSLRPTLINQGTKGLSLNVDVANGTFWRAQELGRSLMQAFDCTYPQLQQRFKEARSKDWRQSYFRRDLTRYRRVGVTAYHKKGEETQWTIDEICGMDPTEAKFPDPDDKSDVEPKKKRQISVQQYFKDKYKINLAPGLPVARMTKKIRGGPVYLPIEYLRIDPNQRYNAKLSDKQTSAMIKFAVTLPAERRQAVNFGVKLLDWPNDPYLKKYGIKVTDTPTRVKARVLPPPSLGFGPVSKPTPVPERDLVAGRWRFDGKRFIIANDRPLESWGICVISAPHTCSPEQVKAFAQNFIKIFEGHGGVIKPDTNNPARGKQPWIGLGHLSDGGELVAKAFNATGNTFNKRPNFMFFIVNDRNVEVYRRIKKSMDCRFGIASQVLQSRHVQNNQSQYISNVCMKVNAKLGGATSWARSTYMAKINPKAASTSTMIVGADVSHPAPGAGSDEKASFAAITVSRDQHFTRYWAEVQTNGCRIEMLTRHNINTHFGDMARRWCERVGGGLAPKRLLYIRDGVSEGQYAAVLENEVHDLKETFRRIGCKDIPKFTVVIAGKRHHIRFFPEKGDRNGNPIPGTLVETGCTHPFEFDFYLCPHVAIKGTARPIHYQVILNEAEFQSTELQALIFEHSFQYARSTTPVSLHPAVYYAHLAADRARAHVSDSPVSSGKKEQKAKQETSTGTPLKAQVEAPPLVDM
ncbi:eukaryotic translation initiation factor 2C 2, partial [Aaosphaeria arxii CBS 175.79]